MATYNKLYYILIFKRCLYATRENFTKNTRISIVIPKDLKLEADKIANNDGRSLGGWIRKLISDAVSEYNKSDTSQ